MTKIPFGNSKFQIENFIANEHTPERAVRMILLQVDKKKLALSECMFRRKEQDINRRELQKKLKKAKGFAKERQELELEKIDQYKEREDKLVDDCLAELAVYKDLLSKLPEVNREQFEDAELGYWTKRLISDANREVQQSGRIEKGTLESLEKIGFVPRKNEKGQLMIVKADDIKLVT